MTCHYFLIQLISTKEGKTMNLKDYMLYIAIYYTSSLKALHIVLNAL